MSTIVDRVINNTFVMLIACWSLYHLVHTDEIPMKVICALMIALMLVTGLKTPDKSTDTPDPDTTIIEGESDE